MKWYVKQKVLNEKKDGQNTQPLPAEIEQQDSGINELDQEISAYSEYETKQEEVQEEKKETFEPSTLSKGAYLQGNIETMGDLLIYGTIKGDVLCHANLSIYGSVEGTIQCESAYIECAKVTGNLTCSGKMEISEGSTIQGDIQSASLMNGGKIVGNVHVSNDIQYYATSSIIGDSFASEIQVDHGAMIQGVVNVEKN